MSAPENRHEQQRYAGTGGAPAGAGAPGAATGSVRSYGMGHGEARAGGHPQPGAAGRAVVADGSAGPAPYQPYQQAPGQPYYGHPAYGQYPPYGQPVPGAYQMPATSVPQQMPQRKRRRGVVIGIIVAIVCVVLAALLAFTMCDGGMSRRQGDAGQLEGKTDAEIQAELDRVVDEGMFNISVASVVEFESGTSEGELRIENVPGNRYLMRVTIVRNDTGEQLYQTDVIEPNHHIQRDALDVALPAGTYECTALFEALDPETEQQVGQAAAVITVNVRS